VCGQISVIRLPDAVKQINKYKVTMVSQDKDKASMVTTETDPHGAFCFKAKSGAYIVKVRVSFFFFTVGLLRGFRGFKSFNS